MKHLSKRAAEHLVHGRGSLLMQVAVLFLVSWDDIGRRWWAVMPQVWQKLKKPSFFSKFCTILCACPLLSWRKAHFYHFSLWLSLCLLSNSFHSCSECFPYWSLLFINVLGISCIFKLLHKINKRAGNGGKKNPDLFVMLERPLRTLSIFPSIVGV